MVAVVVVTALLLPLLLASVAQDLEAYPHLFHLLRVPISVRLLLGLIVGRLWRYQNFPNPFLDIVSHLRLTQTFIYSISHIYTDTMVHDPIPPNCKLTHELQEKICRAVSLGSQFKWACLGSGLRENLGRKYRDQGEIDASMGTKSVFADFYLAVKDAEAQLEMRLVKKWTEALEQKEDGWKGIMAFLEKRFKQEWGKAPVELNAQVLDLRKSPEFTQLVAMISEMLPADKQEELSELLLDES